MQSTVRGNDRDAFERISHLLQEEKLTEAQIESCIEKLKENGVHSIEQLAAFPVTQIGNLGLKPKSRAVLKAIIPKLNGMVFHSTDVLGFSTCEHCSHWVEVFWLPLEGIAVFLVQSGTVGLDALIV